MKFIWNNSKQSFSSIVILNKHRVDENPYYKSMRYMSFPVVYGLQYLPITPNMVSACCHILTILSAYLLSFNSLWINLLAVLILHIAVLCDFVDGTLARTIDKTSKFNAHYLDRIYHEITYALLFIGIGYGTGYIELGFIAAMGLVTGSYILHLKNWLLARYANEIVTEHDFEGNMMGSKLEQVALSIYSYPMKYIRFILLIMVLLQRLDILIIFYSIFLPLRILGGIGFFYLKFKERDRK